MSTINLRVSSAFLLRGLTVFLLTTTSVSAQWRVQKGPYQEFEKPILIYMPGIPAPGPNGDYFPGQEISSNISTTDLFEKYGVAFEPTPDSLPSFFWSWYDLFFYPHLYISNQAIQGTSANKPMVARFRYPLKRILLELWAKRSNSNATLRGYTPAGFLLGEKTGFELIPANGKFLINGFFETNDPSGIGTLVIDYGAAEESELLQTMVLEYLNPRVFRTYLPQIAVGKISDWSIQTEILLNVTLNAGTVNEGDIKVRFCDQKGNPMPMKWNGECSNLLSMGTGIGFSLTPQTCDSTIQIGWAVVESPHPVSAGAVFWNENAGFKEKRAAGYSSVGAGQEHSAIIRYDRSQGRDTAIAIANVSDQENRVKIDFAKLDYIDPNWGVWCDITLKPKEQRAFFFSEMCKYTADAQCRVGEKEYGKLEIRSHDPNALLIMDSTDGTLTFPLPVASSQD